MKIKNFNSGWGQMTVTNARGRLLVRLGVDDLEARVKSHNDGQERAERKYDLRFLRYTETAL